MQQQQQGGGSQYGVPPSEMSPFSPSVAVGSRPPLLGIPGSDPLQQPPPTMPEVASPINSRPPPARAMDFDELTPAVAGSFPDDEALAAGDDAERIGSTSGNRWPRQETLALLKIRSEMDAAFRDATLKGPLWEEVSRKLAELGYKRSAKKCKEKFENVHKYYKRTKEGRAGRQDGKSYRFFTQLEALYSGGAGAGAVPSSTAAPGPAPSPAPSTTFTAGVASPPASRAQPISAVAPPTMAMPTRVGVPELTNPSGPQGISSSAAAAAAAGLIFSSNSSSYSSASETDGEETDQEAGESQEGRKRKRSGVESSGTSRKMLAFFDRLMGQVMERQEAMQQRFLEVIEKREQDRMIRDEAWRRQEMGRISREQEHFAQERAMATSRDTAIISYLQKISGQPITIPIPTTPISISPIPPAAVAAATQQQTPPPPTPQQTKAPALPQPPAQQHQSGESTSSVAAELIPFSDPQEAAAGGGSLEPLTSPSRWPKAEVHALINLRSGLDSKYQESGPKGTLWEEISAGMQRLGYNRSAKRCKEKWENINKYFKKVKESNKKRPEDSKTCPYFHQLDALYRRKLVGGTQHQQGQETNQQQQAAPPPAPLPPSAPPQPAAEPESKNGTSGASSNRNGGNSDNVQVPTSNGGLPPSFSDEGSKKPEDIVKELMGQHQQQALADDYDKSDEADSLEQEDEDNDEEDNDDDGKLQYEIQFQRQNVSAGGGGNASASAASSFLAIVQ